MKAILEFNLDEQDDQYAHRRCTKALDMALVIWEYQQYFRSQFKYGELSPERYEELEKAQTRFNSLIDLHNISIDELVY